MNPSVTQVEAIDNHRLQLQFENGEYKLFDVTPFLDKGIFIELKNEEYFKKGSHRIWVYRVAKRARLQ